MDKLQVFTEIPQQKLTRIFMCELVVIILLRFLIFRGKVNTQDFQKQRTLLVHKVDLQSRNRGNRKLHIHKTKG